MAHSKAYTLALNDLKRKRLIGNCDLDLVYAGFYFAGKFNLDIPVEFGRDAMEIIIRKLQKDGNKKETKKGKAKS